MERDNVVCVIFDQIIDHGITSLGDRVQILARHINI